MAAYQPDEAAIEETFVSVNASSTLKLGHARAAVMIAPVRSGVPVSEYAAKLVKKAVVGTGGADKQIAFMVQRLLPTSGSPVADAADALAVAIAHAHAAHRYARGSGKRRMIGRLRGVLAEVGDEDALIDVGGVGYVVRCGTRTLSRFPALGDEVLLHVEHQFNQESGPRLYGFVARDDRRAFTALQSVQGVGPKAALGVLDVLSPGELAQAVARDDKAAVGRANGVGPKLALRIVVELKDKQLGEVSFHPAGTTAVSTPAVGVGGRRSGVGADGSGYSGVVGAARGRPGADPSRR